ncbi:hypothetical protein [Gloeobacter kilaueensis]|uniref:Uncharacterized protein n=1 Tax=Gloeobacter kilaueensis (strain ATCC BAA-2537 / CCAP 1431/1 / ULC 316 / JS1) TaxID=1183438 RepID=U5QNH3_GLOK1|nr:hypothetical protein [Gloeobacter kilaueensis]AGY60537.1 hypothetical protein GKIL_4291 [Gloeobacter kilaueensis JS1]
MSENLATSAAEQEVEQVIAELEQYRQRIVDDALRIGKLAKLPQKLTLAHLENHPELQQIDAMIEALRTGEPIPIPAEIAAQIE